MQKKKNITIEKKENIAIKKKKKGWKQNITIKIERWTQKKNRI